VSAATEMGRDDHWPPCELYQAYVDARDDAACALADWWAAPYGAKREAFAIYRAAADREDAAAEAWLRSCETYDAALAAP
jgi:hypothetical protein